MGILYGFILIIAFIIAMAAFDADDAIAFVISLVAAIVLCCACIIPHPSWGTEVIDSTVYELVSLDEIDDDYTENDYILYEPVSDKLIFYYKDNNGIIRRSSLPSNSYNVKISYGKETKYVIDELDYDTATKRHLLVKSFTDNYTLFVPEGSVIQSLLPEYAGG